MHQDFKDLLSAFNAHSVRYLIVGGYAYARYAEPRTTKDLDLFIRPDPGNALAAYNALAQFGACLAERNAADQAWETSEPALVDEQIPVRYISSDNLIANKLAAARPQDLVDVAKLRHAAQTRMRNSGNR